MKITYKTIIQGINACDTEAISPIQFCCDSMKYAFDSCYIGFGYAHAFKEYPPSVYICTKDYDGEVDEAINIIFCPFCAEKIEIIKGPTFEKVITHSKVMTDVEKIEYVEQKVGGV